MRRANKMTLERKNTKTLIYRVLFLFLNLTDMCTVLVLPIDIPRLKMKEVYCIFYHIFWLCLVYF